MARIPEFTRGRLASRLQTSAISAAGAEFEAAAEVGRLVSDVAFEVGRRAKKADDDTFLSEAAIDYDARAQEVFTGWQQKNRDNPRGKEQELDDALNVLSNEMAKKAPSEESKAAFGRITANQRLKFGRQSQAWSTNQVVENAGNRAERSAETLNTSAFRNADSALIPDMFEQVNGVTAGLADVVDPNTLTEQNRIMKAGVVKNTIDGLIADDRIEEAQSVLDSKQFDDVLGADGIKQSQRAIDSKAASNARMQERMQKLKQTDPWQFVASTDTEQFENTFEEIDLVNNTTESFRKRQQFIEETNERLGVDLPIMTNEEVAVFQATIDSVNADQGAVILNSLATGVDAEQYEEVANLLFEKQPSLGGAMGVADQAPQVSSAIINGDRLLRNKTVAMPNKQSFDAEYMATIQRSLPDPASRKFALEAVRAHYANSVFKENDTSGQLSTDLFENSFEQVVGPVVKYNDTETLSLRDQTGQFVDAENFEDTVDNLFTEGDVLGNQLQATQGDVPRFVNGLPVELDTLKEHAQLQVIGDGQYWIKLFDDVTVDKQGNPYVLDMKKVFLGDNFGQLGAQEEVLGDELIPFVGVQ